MRQAVRHGKASIIHVWKSEASSTCELGMLWVLRYHVSRILLTDCNRNCSWNLHIANENKRSQATKN